VKKQNLRFCQQETSVSNQTARRNRADYVIKGITASLNRQQKTELSFQGSKSSIPKFVYAMDSPNFH
jgi:hypothetical protein